MSYGNPDTTGWDEARKRYQELSTKDTCTLTNAEDREMSQLWERLHSEGLRAGPKLTCCQAIQTYPTVYLSVGESTEGPPETARWRAMLVPDSMDPNQRDSTWYENLPEAHFCPYCGTALPKVRRKADPPKPLRVSGGGHYCDTCEKRLGGCMCLPPAAAFESVS